MTVKEKTKEIVLATRNSDKVKEIKEILGDLDVKITYLKNYPNVGEIEETGATLEENAFIKARTVAKQVNKIVMADDSGLEVDVLGGKPGVRSSRFAGKDANYSDNNKKLLDLMKDVPDENRTARFRCVVAICTPDDEEEVVEGTCEGIIGREEKGEAGFGYDPVFVVPEFGKTFAELGYGIKNEMSHRAKAFRRAAKIVKNTL